LDRQPFDRIVRWRTVAKVLSMGLVTGIRFLVPMFCCDVQKIVAYGATIRDGGTGSTKVRAGRCTR
jgi:hypothetical protein